MADKFYKMIEGIAARISLWAWKKRARILIGMALKTGAEVYKNKKEAQQLESVAEKNYMAKMAAGEIEYQKAIMDNNNQGWKDELVLVIVVLPIVVLAWSIFSGDPQAKEKLDLFFEYFNNFPDFINGLY
jgi:uncharacterized ion transporter superfamily protein YfcC